MTILTINCAHINRKMTISTVIILKNDHSDDYYEQY